MPIFEYACEACGHEFEFLVLRNKEPHACEKCGAEKLNKLLSLPSLRSETTRGLAMRAAKKRDQRQGRERTEEQRLYELNHDD